MRFCAALLCFALIGATARGQTWTELTPESGPSPSPRRNAGSIYDPATHRMIVFGGKTSSGDVGDVWAFDLATNTWEELTPSSGPAPAGRFTPDAVYDPAGGRMIIWSGQGSGTFLNDVWAFDLSGETWSEFTPSMPIPNIRYGTAAVFDPQDRELVTFAGFTNQGRFDDTWRFDVDADAWIDVTPPSGNPGERCLHSASYDIAGHRMIMYGGQRSGPLDDLWAFDLDAGDWSELTPSVRPDGRFFAAHVHDSIRQRSLVFGGRLQSSRTDEVWEFDLSDESWAEIAPTGSGPEARDGATAIWVVTEDRMILFGGNTGSALQSDLWSLSFAPAEGVAFPGWIQSDGDAFVWTVPINGDWVRGDLDDVASYGFDASGSLVHSTELPHAADPAPNSGHYYLLRPQGNVGSWQTGAGSEPARDAALP